MYASHYTENVSRFRRIEAWSMRDLGFTWREIGEELGVTGARAKQLADEAVKRREISLANSPEYCDGTAIYEAMEELGHYGRLAA